MGFSAEAEAKANERSYRQLTALSSDIQHPPCLTSVVLALAYTRISLHLWSLQDLQSLTLWTWTCGTSFHWLWNTSTIEMTSVWCIASQ